jgi:hypothetical protein
MRFAVLTAVILLSACASEGLNMAPPPGVDLSGKWKLNEADSDDPMHLLQIANQQQIQAANAAAHASRGGQQAGYPALAPPATPSMGVLGGSLHWPGKQLEIHQVGGVLTFTSDGKNRICQPGNEKSGRPPHPPRGAHDNQDRDDMPAEREAPPPHCGWFEKTLIFTTRERDDELPPYEERYSITHDGQRLVEEIAFRGGRSSGFVMSRVWDKLPQ